MLLNECRTLKSAPVVVGDNTKDVISLVSRNGYCQSLIRTSGILTVPGLRIEDGDSFEGFVSTHRTHDLCEESDHVTDVTTRDVIRGVMNNFEGLRLCKPMEVIQTVITYHMCPVKILGPARCANVAMIPVSDRAGISRILSLENSRGRLILSATLCRSDSLWRGMDVWLASSH